jgi:Mrp family chromosome partitioning ATPase
MERIERALEVARLHRNRQSDAVAPRPAPEPAPAAPTFAEALVDQRASLRPEDAPEIEVASREVLRERYVVFPDEHGPAAVAYQMLRTQVLQRARQHDMRCIGVVSAASGEGKTVTAVNLALSLAADSGQTVILVDLDLRRPSIATVLGLACDKGVETHLTGADSLDEIWKRCAGIDRLVVVPALKPLPGSAEMLAGTATAELFRALRAASGDPFIVVDLPPALLSADALAVASLLDGVVLVVTEERTRREDIQRVFELLRATPVVGTVLNASSEAEARSY